MGLHMRIEFEFNFKGTDHGDGTLSNACFDAVDRYIKGNKGLGNIGEVKFEELTDWDQDDGLNCCAVLEGSEEDLRYLVLKNGGMAMGPDGFLLVDECNNFWEECVEVL